MRRDKVMMRQCPSLLLSCVLPISCIKRSLNLYCISWKCWKGIMYIIYSQIIQSVFPSFPLPSFLPFPLVPLPIPTPISFLVVTPVAPVFLPTCPSLSLPDPSQLSPHPRYPTPNLLTFTHPDMLF